MPMEAQMDKMRRKLNWIEIVFFENLLAQQFFKFHFCCLLCSYNAWKTHFLDSKL